MTAPIVVTPSLISLALPLATSIGERDAAGMVVRMPGKPDRLGHCSQGAAHENAQNDRIRPDRCAAHHNRHFPRADTTTWSPDEISWQPSMISVPKYSVAHGHFLLEVS